MPWWTTDGKGLGELKAEIEYSKRKRRERNAVEKKVKNHLFSAPIILVITILKLLLVGNQLGNGAYGGVNQIKFKLFS